LDINEIELYKEILLINIIKQINFTSNISYYLINYLFYNTKYMNVQYLNVGEEGEESNE
jgi:hypothetical protein